MSMFKKLLLILCFGVTSFVVYGCTQPQPAGEEEAVVEEEVVEETPAPTEAPTAAPMDDTGESGTN
jgi:hypothetical protein